jgi:hypothetical protein
MGAPTREGDAMNKWMRVLLFCVGLFGLTGSMCTSTYTQADLLKQEEKQDAAAVAEEKRDQEIGEQGGEGQQDIDQQVDDVEGGNAPDF